MVMTAPHLTGVLHEMPAVRDLDGVRERPRCGKRVTAAAVARDNLDLLLFGKPGLSRRRLPIRQKRDGPAPLKITDNRAVSEIAAPGPVIDPDHIGWCHRRLAMSAHDAQQCIVADRDHEAPGKARRRTAAKSQTEMTYDGVEPGCTPRPRRQFLEPLGEDPTAVKDGIAVEPAAYFRQLHHSAADWKVRPHGHQVRMCAVAQRNFPLPTTSRLVPRQMLLVED